MHFIAKLAASNDCIALTSRYVYSKDKRSGKVERVVFRPAPGESMIDFLKNTLIKKSDMAIIVFSVAAGHYNETHWCCEQGKKTLGITFVRSTKVLGLFDRPRYNCDHLNVSKKQDFGFCNADYPWTGWDCIKSRPCPFKKQGISINQLEYFMTNHNYMHLYAIEEIQKVEEVVVPFVEDKLF